ncbi:MAG TPA: ankyrin repeat domain-containing protein [Thermoanaerobaculia bacterium]|nr:ankyrin repeat domain-containing protein [Thermoanaerobaculia bacterium]
MPVRHLPAEPDLRHLQLQAKDLLRGHRDGDGAVLQRLREFHPRYARATDAELRSAPLTLADAYFALAREYGFSSWVRLRTAVISTMTPDFNKAHHERITDSTFRQAVDLLDAGDLAGLREYLRSHSDLITQRVTFEGENYFQQPALLEFIAENPVRHESMPPNAVEVAELLIEAGAPRASIDETLMLVSSGRVARECGLQVPLIELLAKHGASLDGAMLPALVHAEFEAVEALIHLGAPITLDVAAGTGRVDDAKRMFVSADASSRHRALALAAQHGHAAILTMLLEAGEDPNRFNPVGCHSHSTPLHQAALAGHLDSIRVLIEHGARTDIGDTLFNGIALEWARYANQEQAASYLARNAR